MHRLSVGVQSFHVFRALPNHVDGLFVIDPIEDAIAAEDYEIVIILNTESFDLRSGDQDLRVTSELNELGFHVPKRPTDG